MGLIKECATCGEDFERVSNSTNCKRIECMKARGVKPSKMQLKETELPYVSFNNLYLKMGVI